MVTRQISYDGIKLQAGSKERKSPQEPSDKEHLGYLCGRLRSLARRGAMPKVVVINAAINDLRSQARRGESPELWF